MLQTYSAESTLRQRLAVVRPWSLAMALTRAATLLRLMSWWEVDLETKTITLPAARTKNHTEHVVPLTDKAVAILEAIPRRADRDLIFGTGKSGFSNWDYAKRSLHAA